MNRVFLRQLLAEGVPVFALGMGGLWLISAVGITASGALLRPSDLLQVAGLITVSRLHWVLALAGCWASASVIARWHQQGALLAWAAVGGRVAQLVPAGAMVGGVLVLCFLGVSEGLGPLSQRTALRMLHERATVTVPPEGGVQLGEARALATRDAVWLIEGERVIRAETAEVQQGVLQLGAGELWTPEMRVRWDGWSERMGGERRISVDELPTAAVIRRAQATALAGGDASYEWAIAYKRLTLPLGFAMLPLMLLPLSGVTRWRTRVVGVLVGMFVVVRIGDAVALSGFAAAGAALPLLWPVVLGLWGSRKW